jgi:hypothetical protein
MNIPKRLVLEFYDGSQKEIEFSKLSMQIQAGLAELGLYSKPAETDISKSYMLLRWQNGWQEVLGIEKDHLELIRYYSIERIEETGRIALNTGDDFPVLIYVRRFPKQVESALLADCNSAKMHVFMEKATVKQGGTTEHIFYDKKNPEFSVEDSKKADSWLSELADSAHKELIKNGFTSENVLSIDLDHKHTLYGKIAKALGIRAMKTQEDMFGFIELLLGKI